MMRLPSAAAASDTSDATSLRLLLLCGHSDLDHGPRRPGALGAHDGHELLPDVDLELHAGRDARGDLHLNILRHGEEASHTILALADGLLRNRQPNQLDT